MRGRIRRLAAHTTNGQFSPSIHSQSKFGTSGATAYFLKDGHGSTRALSDESGNLIPGEQYNYDAFGNRQSGTSNPATKYLYTGQQFDGQTGLYDLRARYYNPGDGRFLSQDTYKVDKYNPTELNRYNYVHNDPIGFIDLSGHFSYQLTLQFVSLPSRTVLLNLAYATGLLVASLTGALILIYLANRNKNVDPRNPEDYDDSNNPRDNMGDNSGRDKNTVEAAGQSVGIKDQEDLHSFSDFVEQEKKKIGRGGKDNFSYKALQELGRQWLASRGVKHNEC